MRGMARLLGNRIKVREYQSNSLQKSNNGIRVILGNGSKQGNVRVIKK